MIVVAEDAEKKTKEQNVNKDKVEPPQAESKQTADKSSSSSSSSARDPRDLIYEAMKMRTGNWKPWDRDRVSIVGGGVLEKELALASKKSELLNKNDELMLTMQFRHRDSSHDIPTHEGRGKQINFVVVSQQG